METNDFKKRQKRGTARKEKITPSLRVDTIRNLDSYLNGQNVTRSYGLDYIITYFLTNCPNHTID